jgi:hypothetical protein
VMSEIVSVNGEFIGKVSEQYYMILFDLINFENTATWDWRSGFEIATRCYLRFQNDKRRRTKISRFGETYHRKRQRTSR